MTCGLPDGTMATFGSFPAFSLRRLGRATGLGMRRLEDTFPKLCRPPLPPGNKGGRKWRGEGIRALGKGRGDNY